MEYPMIYNYIYYEDKKYVLILVLMEYPMIL